MESDKKNRAYQKGETRNVVYGDSPVLHSNRKENISQRFIDPVVSNPIFGDSKGMGGENSESVTLAQQVLTPIISIGRISDEYLDAINKYRAHLSLPQLTFSSDLSKRAIERANYLSKRDKVESTSRSDLIYKDQPIGETVISCRSPVNDGSSVGKLIYRQLVNDLKNGNPPKKRYAPILNQDCKEVGFGLVRNDISQKDYIVIYYYPVRKAEESASETFYFF
ncbi:unnamed protein product [Didymodactylos carnosus]|uniref:SCP domain-containing protein n=1 Tax=Didymodactylos carnosus TaxID=1234261 RepID=A0A813U673_9BILA|nr:unnamed protein product [Didymodactylos carnosus]CAF0927993.1 unnamed protein product [Didymodactylos carnosus]CAF3608716.1 unnamed protein product [Didymodactylos carnosus]CAF3704900.1 unnamed protein product [Didymodactylos carnosus]